MSYLVFYSKRAEAQLGSIFRYIAKASSPRIAASYILALREYCESFAVFPVRGTDQSEIAPGLRSVGFRRSATIVFRVAEPRVIILAVFYRGLNVRDRL